MHTRKTSVSQLEIAPRFHSQEFTAFRASMRSKSMKVVFTIDLTEWMPLVIDRFYILVFGIEVRVRSSFIHARVWYFREYDRLSRSRRYLIYPVISSRRFDWSSFREEPEVSRGRNIVECWRILHTVLATARYWQGVRSWEPVVLQMKSFLEFLCLKWCYVFL